jgi:hypothetical protein
MMNLHLSFGFMAIIHAIRQIPFGMENSLVITYTYCDGAQI